MLEIEKIMDYLTDYGFKEGEIEFFKDYNDKMYSVNLDTVIANIDFLGDKGLDKNEIMNLIRNNPLMLTCSQKRKDAFEKIYIEKLSLTNKDIKKMLSKNPFIYNVSPINVDKYITNWLSTSSLENVKNSIINNPEILDM